MIVTHSFINSGTKNIECIKRVKIKFIKGVINGLA